MNEQELFRIQKIEKREKFDTILAYILIVILLGAILLVLYLKFIRKEEIIPEEYTPSYISLNELSNSFNSSSLVTAFTNDNATLSSSVVGTALSINYLKEETNINLNIPLVENELQVEYSEENKNVAENIYKELATIVCTYNGNIESSCRNIINSININNQVEGIRIVENGNNTTVYIDIMKKINVNSIPTYTEVTSVELSNTNYILVLENTQINNINITTTDNKLTLTGNVSSLNEDNILKILIKLYDSNNNVLGENNYEYTEDAPLTSSSAFEISFDLDDSLKLENINKYSIEVVK